MTVDSEHAEIKVFDGQVAANNKQGEILIKQGFTGIAYESQTPQIKALTIRPEDAVQWTLYYPPVINIEKGRVSKLNADDNQQQIGDLDKSLNLLDKNQDLQNDSHYLTYIASLLLSVGSVDEALKFIDQVQTIGPDYSDALALRAIVSVVKNRQDEALNIAQKATTQNPQSATAQIALSYAYQSKFKIELALKATQKAVELSPDNALAWARLSELQLSTGERSDALKSAQKAQQLNPKLDRTQTILGFAYLAEVDIDEANTAFTKSINLNSADPLARLGLGLAKIRKGDIEDGTQDLETAVSLDPDNATMRSYLGKAYYELKNNDYAETELTIAKEVDPNDPTPWFYDAIRKQTTNRPVEALHDMQKAIELNDNRGVYRSKLLLDEDLAARSASLGRIYNDLGFQQLGLVQGWKSVNTDPSNYSAHRLLADNYASRPRHEIARVSELLQSQLLQPVNVNPIQPSLAESNLLILDGSGPSNTSFNEFNPLFTRDRLALQTSGVYGSNNTWGDEVVQSGLWNKFSYSLGQFHYETDGFRENNDLKQDIYNAFIQGQITPKLNFLGEFRRQDRTQGDLELHFDPDNFSRTARRSIEQDTYRIGARYSPSSNSDIIVSSVYADRKEISQPTPSRKTNNQQDGYHIEARYLFNYDWLHLTIGGGNYNIDTNIQRSKDNKPRPSIQSTDIAYNAYSYSNIRLFDSLTLTLGLSYDHLDIVSRKVSRINPKFGFELDITDSARLRLSYTETVKRSQVVDQTIEPTVVAGFNQFFDDVNGTVSKRYGVGLDTTITPNLHGGIEFSGRELNFRTFDGSKNPPAFVTTKRREKLLHAYLYWTPISQFSLGLEPVFEQFIRSKDDPFVVNSKEPDQIDTLILPLTLRVFSPSGFFAGVKGSFVDQSIKSDSIANSPYDSDDFFTFDASIGYRLPNRRGIIGLEAKNIFDQKFNHEGLGIQSFNAVERPRFIPDQMIFFRATFVFN